VFQVRLHGRGGQGVVTAAEVLSVAAFLAGRHAQAFPSFGSERTGAPVVSYCRVSEHPIRTREPINDPDALLILDPTLIHQVDLMAGLGADGYVLVNTARDIDDLGLGAITERLAVERCLSVPATDLALEHLGRPIPNIVLLGGLAAVTGLVPIDAVVAAIEDRFTGPTAAGNVAAARAAYGFVTRELEELTRASAT
jgi:pyruvate ferredoxin oxidoreductase gamma subunit